MKASDHMRARARELRTARTLSEIRLWNWLRNRSFDGVKFRRQVPLGGYVVDFYCPKLKLVIEVDGKQHDTDWMADYDNERSLFLRDRGIEVVRISNEVVAKDPATAEEIIRDAITKASS